MNNKTSVFNTERVFLRSCLESTPQQAQLRSFNPWADKRPRTPTRLHVLKQKLLQTVLKKTALPHVQRQLCGAANLAAEIVWNTACPLLLFPSLFEEMTAKILSRFVLDEPIDDANLAAPQENDPVFDQVDTANGWSRPISGAKSFPAGLAFGQA